MAMLDRLGSHPEGNHRLITLEESALDWGRFRLIWEQLPWTPTPSPASDDKEHINGEEEQTARAAHRRSARGA